MFSYLKNVIFGEGDSLANSKDNALRSQGAQKNRGMHARGQLSEDAREIQPTASKLNTSSSIFQKRN